MKKLAGAFLLVTACVGLAFAQVEKAPGHERGGNCKAS